MPRMRLTGVRQLERTLTRLVAEAGEIRSEVAQAWADDVADTAQATVPVDTGRLQGAIEARVNPDSDTETAEVGVWDRDAYYSQFVEAGTSEMTAQPFVQPAFEAHRGDLPRYAREAIGRRVR